MSDEITQNPIIEPAKSARSSCRICQKKIEKGFIRIGVPSPYTLPDGRTVSSYRFYHPDCVPYDRIASILDILDSVTTIEHEDKNQVKITLEKIQMLGSSATKGRIIEPFFEYSRSGRGSCRICENKIEKGVFRIAEPTQIELTNGRRILGQKLFHINCFLDSSANPKNVFQNLMDNSIQEKKLSEEQLEKLKEDFQMYLSRTETAYDVLVLIGKKPVKIETLKKFAKEKGVPFKIVEQSIEEGLMRGEFFQPSPNTIQRMN
ncbi:MAG: hypothetical protein ACFE9L_12785 [Candidatus Hodarchaeota archaeon]